VLLARYLVSEGDVRESIEPKSCRSLYKQAHEMTVMTSTYLHAIFIAGEDVKEVTSESGLDGNWSVLLSQHRL